MSTTSSPQQSPLYTPQHAMPRVIVPVRTAPAARPAPHEAAPTCPQCSAELMRAGDDCVACGYVARRSRVVLVLAVATGLVFVAALAFGVLRGA